MPGIDLPVPKYELKWLQDADYQARQTAFQRTSVPIFSIFAYISSFLHLLIAGLIEPTSEIAAEFS